MKKTWLIGMGVVALAVGTALAEGEAPAVPKDKEVKKEAKAPAVKPELKDITVIGVVEKATDKKGGESFLLKTGDGVKVRLPKGKNTPDYASLLGATVKIAGKGYEMEKNGKKHCVLKTITSADKVEAPAQPAANP